MQFDLRWLPDLGLVRCDPGSALPGLDRRVSPVLSRACRTGSDKGSRRWPRCRRLRAQPFNMEALLARILAASLARTGREGAFRLSCFGDLVCLYLSAPNLLCSPSVTVTLELLFLYA